MKDNVFSRVYQRLVPAALLLTFVVVVLGAWVRLSDAGLGCPDWPGCYGTLTVPDDPAELALAADRYPHLPVVVEKAWKEMVHRYAAAMLGLLILAIAFCALRNRHDPAQPVALPVGLVFLVVFQGLLGMLTVTWLLKPAIVMGHLLGGLTTLGILGWLSLSIMRPARRARSALPQLRTVALASLAAVLVQIALGGWTSANYAALACPDFPTCQTQWWPQMDLREGFVLWRGLGINYEGGVLDNPARTAIHMMHRLGALVVTLVLSLAIWRCWRSGRRPDIRAAAVITGVLLAAQITIGASIVLLSLPLWLATAHNATAALLLLATLNLNHALRHAPE